MVYARSRARTRRSGNSAVQSPRFHVAHFRPPRPALTVDPTTAFRKRPTHKCPPRDTHAIIGWFSVREPYVFFFISNFFRPTRRFADFQRHGRTRFAPIYRATIERFLGKSELDVRTTSRAKRERGAFERSPVAMTTRDARQTRTRAAMKTQFVPPSHTNWSAITRSVEGGVTLFVGFIGDREAYGTLRLFDILVRFFFFLNPTRSITL